MKTFLTFLAIVVGLAVGSLISVYVWLTLFVGVLHYDYVTASNMLFLLSIVIPIILAIASLFSQQEKDWMRLIVALLIYPFVLSSAFMLYEALQHPAISDQVNVLAMYRAAVGVPISAAARAFSGLAPMAASSVKTVEGSPILMMVASAVVGGIVKEVFALFGRLLPKHA